MAAFAQQSDSLDAGAGGLSVRTQGLGGTTGRDIVKAARGVGAVPETVIQAVLAQDRDVERTVAEYLTRDNALPRRMAARAVALVQTFRDEARLGGQSRLFEIASVVSEVASRVLNAPRVVQVLIHKRYRPTARDRAFDLGGWDMPLAPGFERLTPAGLEVKGARLETLTGSGLGALQGDGIAGIQGLHLKVDSDGAYRVILLTSAGDAVADRLLEAPFGVAMVVNGTEHVMGRAPPETWLSNGVLVRPETVAEAVAPSGGRSLTARQLAKLATSDVDDVPLAGTGAAIAFKTDSIDGAIDIGFRTRQTGLGVFLTGLIVEPVDEATSLMVAQRMRTVALARGLEAVIRANAIKDEATAAALAAYAASKSPADAPAVAVAALKAVPGAAARIAGAVAGLPKVDVAALRAAIEAEPAIPVRAKDAALAAVGGGS